MTARIKAKRLTEEAELLEVAADLQDNLDAAKTAVQEDPSPENMAARQAAMDEMDEFRTWVRGVARLRVVRDKLTDPKVTDEKRESLEAELASLEKRFGELADGLEQLRASAGRVPLPAGSVEVVPVPATSRARVPKPGGGS